MVYRVAQARLMAAWDRLRLVQYERKCGVNTCLTRIWHCEQSHSN